jgi:hypothetical protein
MGKSEHASLETVEAFQKRTQDISRPEVTTVDAVIVEEGPMSDDKGRPTVMYMTDRELLEEMVISQRQLSDLVANFMGSMDRNPMMRMFAGKMGM